MNNDLNKELDGMYTFMSQAYAGNWQYRWADTPYLKKLKDQDKGESILAHQWSCIGFWFVLRRSSPALNAIINTQDLYELLWLHDLGETYTGDVPLFLQLQGQGVDKVAIERIEIEKMSKTLKATSQMDILTAFDNFENGLQSTTNLEVLMAKFIDHLQGDHFALEFGNNLDEYSEPISKILNKRIIPIALRLMEVLAQLEHHEALKEIKNITEHHLELVKNKNIKVNLEIFNSTIKKYIK